MNDMSNVHREVGTTRKRADVADYRTPPIQRQWYVVGYTSDFGEELKEITLLNRSLVTYRTSTGEPVILQNRCAHRSFPLSESWREDDAIRCRYHGAKFDSDGRLIDLPSQKSCPNVSVRKYPARESGPFVWVWMAPCEPDEAALPQLPYNTENWEIATGYRHAPSNAFFMVENLADITHIPFLHKETLKYPREFATTALDIKVDGDVIRFDREVNDRFYHRTPIFPKGTSDLIDKYDYDVESISFWMSTAWTYGHINLNVKGTEQANDGVLPAYKSVIAHFLTPETDGTCHYWWCHARNYDRDDKVFTSLLTKGVIMAFEEDMTTCAHLQKMVDQDQHDFREVLFTADKLSVTMRRIVQRQADAEAELFGAVFGGA
jgi:phenylpropionate dioxygenase-like ring-hydroxylating dioxygenase large terminal subunit